MEKNQTNKTNQPRVVLNLTLEQARILNGFIKAHNNGENEPLSIVEQIAKIYHRVDKTITKRHSEATQ